MCLLLCLFALACSAHACLRNTRIKNYKSYGRFMKFMLELGSYVEFLFFFVYTLEIQYQHFEKLL